MRVEVIQVTSVGHTPSASLFHQALGKCIAFHDAGKWPNLSQYQVRPRQHSTTMANTSSVLVLKLAQSFNRVGGL